MYRLGVVSFLNSRPLIAGLDHDARVELRYEVPARLPGLLDAGAADAALVPIVDVLRSGGRYRVISDACIGCDGETMTVRVFSQVPPERVGTLWVDGDSHTSAALARVLWRELHGRDLETRRVDPRGEEVSRLPAVLLIGDKVVAPARARFRYELDLGGAWRRHTGLPFVFAVWAVRSSECGAASDESGDAGARSESLPATGYAELAALLSAARDRGVAQAAAIARTCGPPLGWPVALAERYLTRCLKFQLDARAVAGVSRFAALCAQGDIVPADATIIWPPGLRSQEEA